MERWSPEDEKALIYFLKSKLSYSRIACLLGRTSKAVDSKIQKLNRKDISLFIRPPWRLFPEAEKHSKNANSINKSRRQKCQKNTL